MSAIEFEFVTYKHVPTRKAFQITLEIQEEAQAEVFETLGYPTSGESLYVAVARLKSPESRVLTNPEINPDELLTNLEARGA